MTVFSRFLGKGMAFPVVADDTIGDLARVSGEDNVKSCVRMFLSTRQGERVLREGYGVPELLFENMDPGTADALEQAVRAGLGIYEPRVRVTSVKVVEVTDTTNQRPGTLPGISMVVNYLIKSTGEPGFVAYQLPSEGLSG